MSSSSAGVTDVRNDGGRAMKTKQVFAYGKRGHRIVNVTEARKSAQGCEDGDIAVASTSTRGHDSDTSDVSIRSDTDDTDFMPSPVRPAKPKKLHDNVSRQPETSVPKRLASRDERSRIQRTEPPLKQTQKVAATKKSKKSPRAVKLGRVDVSMPVRHPLSVVSINTPGSPAAPPPAQKKRKPAIGKGTPLRSSSPLVDVDIVIMDAQGRRVSQERRVSKAGVQMNKVVVSPGKPHKALAGLKPLKQSQGARLKPRKEYSSRGKMKARPIVISSDESESEDEPADLPVKLPSLNLCLSPEADERPIPPPRSRIATSRPRTNVIISPETSPSTTQSTPPHPAHSGSKAVALSPLPPAAPAFMQWTPHAIPAKDLAATFSSPVVQRGKARQLTPMRMRIGRTAMFPRPPSPPSPTTPTDIDIDFSFDFSNLTISPGAFGSLAPVPPAYLQPLLEECSQTTPHEFSAFIEMFPYDPIVREGAWIKGPAQFQKIGEASYSEVFGIGDVVLKVIPLRDEEKPRTAINGEEGLDMPAPSDARDVLREIIVTHAMGEMCSGFVQLLRTYIVRGKYPSLLLDLWDEYNEKKGSESARPDSFTVSQVYAIIVLPNGGPDLEAYAFESATKTGWRQACSLFWQVTRALAEAEDIVSFEHRDLHWGQILVKNLAPPPKPSLKATMKTSMDDVVHGVEATIIDLGLARMDTTDTDQIETYWTQFDEEVFEGEGDYQFDVYRMMRTHNRDSWEEYRPLSNVMWLHYLTLKLLQAKKLKPPAARKTATTTTSSFSQKECYDCLVEMEAVLGQCVAVCRAPQVSRNGRRKTQAPTKTSVITGPKSAADVLRIAIRRGWVQ
ncbi:hypothetical protein POSPLADRAFT_1067204 [Postia placenta MAD-698-R-SB12]|uniref:non-specific serine/threonine protein kinase n=1 Tax=Postia placenta MAD-698-R-SB12 TaxID=670580 RepID=A0A1X6MST2_9APHY|nr:hypothetical protein POSPLADRAFT_1067204 [Postia placenta MAD-698-R-SB12]OSX59451.1 hypothetical protein POSPLADRAFT_1067204 [Postia placenta MAD-698-R-SB12]